MTSARQRTATWPTVFLLSLLISFAMFGWTLADGPIVDDNPLLILTHIQQPRDLGRLFIPDANTYWRPLAKLSVMPLSSVFSMATWPHRTTALILHALAVTLLFTLGGRLFGSRAATAAALLFQIHPVHAGTLHWISARPDLLATVLLLGAANFFVCQLDDRRLRWAVATTLLCLGAYLTKEVSFVAPLLLLIVGYTFPMATRKEQFRQIFYALTGPLVTLLAVLAIRRLLLGDLGGPAVLSHPLPGVILGNLLFDVPRALFFPINNAAWSGARILPTVAVIALALGSLVVAYVLYRRRHEYSAFAGLLFGLAGSLPMAPFLYTGPNLEAAYMLYLPSAGFALWIGSLLFPINAKYHPSRCLAWPVFTLLAVVYLPLAASQIGVYHHASKAVDTMVRAIEKDATARRADLWIVETNQRQWQGVPLFYDHVDQLFWHFPSTRGKTILYAGQNFWRVDGRNLAWRQLAARNDVAVLQYCPSSPSIDLTKATLAGWANRDKHDDEPFPIAIAITAPGTEAIAGGVRWRRGPVTLPVDNSAEIADANVLSFSFALCTLDPRAAKEAAFDWTDQGGSTSRLLFAVVDDGRPHTYKLPLATDPRWARTTSVRDASLHFPFVAGELRVTE